MSFMDRDWVRGVSTPLPVGERIRWEGGPDERGLARHVFHIRKIAVYFALLLAWRGALAAADPSPLAFFLAGAIPLGVLAAIALGCSRLLARLTARTAVYAVTDRRVVMRTGLVLTSTINIPFRQIVGVDLKVRRDGTGDIALRLGGEDRLAYLLLWPHARAWYLSQPQPTLRCVPEAARVGALLRDGLLGCAGEVQPAPAEPALRRPVGVPA